MSLPTDSQARKEIPIFSGFISYFPDAVAAVAAHSYASNEKHNPGEPVHWSRDKSTDQLDALARHLTEIGMGVTINEKVELLKAIVWRGMAELQLTIEELDAETRTQMEEALAQLTHAGTLLDEAEQRHIVAVAEGAESATGDPDYPVNG